VAGAVFGLWLLRMCFFLVFLPLFLHDLFPLLFRLPLFSGALGKTSFVLIDDLINRLPPLLQEVFATCALCATGFPVTTHHHYEVGVNLKIPWSL